MKLKTKLWISFLCIIMIPLILFAVFGVLMIQYQFVAIKSSYGVTTELTDFFPNNNRLFDALTKKVRDGITEQVQNDPDFLEDREALDEYCENVAGSFVNVVIVKGDDLYYSYQKLTDEVKTVVLGEADSDEDPGYTVYFSGHNIVLGRVMDTHFNDGSICRIFTIVQSDQWLPEVKTLLVQFGISMVFILFLTAAIFTMWIFKSILQPIRILQEATEKIKSGNLDFHVESMSDDELGTLCTGFEEMRQRLQETSEEKIKFDNESRELISNISHDLKTPITSIKGYVEGIMDGVADTPEKMDRYIRTIYNKANDMQRLIDELTFYSKIDTNRIPYNFNKINVRDYFSDCAEEIGVELTAKNVGFDFSNHVDSDVCVIADPEQLTRVINNIITNSCKYCDKPECRIAMRVKDVGDFVQIEIEDNGKGIAAHDIPYIFDRFYRTDSSRNSSMGGSGIGLSIVKKIIEDHGGKVWATSREGIGTVMCFVLRKYQIAEQNAIMEGEYEPVQRQQGAEQKQPHKNGSIKE